MSAPEIRTLAHAEEPTAAAIYRVWSAAYAVEARLLGVADFFPLRRTAAEIHDSRGEFLGAFLEGRLEGALELSPQPGGSHNIDGLVVHPGAFRRGLGRALVAAAVARVPGALTVSTGEANAPAIALYESLGFAIVRRWRVEGIAMVTLRREGAVGR